MTRVTSRLVLTAMAVCSTAVVSLAQPPTTTTKAETKTFEVLAVDGNRLDVRLPEGTRELTVADDFRFTVNGQQLSVRELKAGMKGTATITTQTTVTPVTVTEVKSGTVRQASANSVLVQTPEGFKMFSEADVEKRGVKIMVDGKPVALGDLHTGQTLTAVIVTSKPPHVMTRKEVQATLAAAGPAAGSAAAGGVPSSGSSSSSASSSLSATKAPLSATKTPSGASAPQASAGGAARRLPKTASSWPLLGLASALSLAMGLALTLRRRLVR
jgi:hypothetical protein